MDQGQATLARRLRALTARRTGLAVCLWGEPGIGKTHTAQALLRETPCRSLSLPARAPLADLARALPRPARLPSWAGRVLERLQHTEAVDGAGAVDALGAALAGLAPFVLHLEDLHESGAEPLERTSALARLVVRTRGVGLLVTSRAPPPEGFETLRLRPLDRAASDALLEAASGAPLPLGALAWLFGRAAGNPLFTLEYFRLLARQGHLWNDGQRWRWRTPPGDLMPLTVEALIERALQEAAPSRELRKVVGVQALLPPGAAPALLAAVTGLSPAVLGTAQGELERRGVLSRGQFAHPLYREVGLRQLGPDERQTLARRALVAFGDDPQTAAGMIDDAGLAPDEALALLERAAAAAGEHELQAARFRARAVEYADGALRGHLALRAAQAYGGVDDREAFRLAELAVQESPENIEALQFLAARHALAGHGAEVGALLARLPDEPGIQADWVARLIDLRFGLGEYLAVTTLWTEHLELRAALDPLTAYHVAFATLFASQGPERLEVAERVAARALRQPLTPVLQSRLLSVCGLARMYRLTPDDLETARHLMDEAVAFARMGEKATWLASTLHNRAILSECLGRHREMLRDLEEAVSLYAEAGSSRHLASTQAKLARHLHEMGEHQRAEELLLESRDLLLRCDASNFLITCEAHLSLLYVEWAPPHAATLALKHAHEALRLARKVGQRNKVEMGLCYLSRAESRFGDASRGLALAEELLHRVEEDGSDAESQMEAHRSLAHALEALGRREEAKAMFRTAERITLEAGLMADAQRIGLELDRLNDDALGAEHRLAWFEERGLLNGVQIVRRYFPDLGRPDRASPGPISPGPINAGSARTGAVSPASQPRLCLEVLGPLRCGPPGQTVQVRGRKRRELLAALLEARLRGRQELARTGLLDLLYPGADDLQAAASLRELVHQTRTALGPGVIQTTPSGYALGEVDADAAAFLEGGETRLWRGVYLQDAAFGGDETVGDALHLALRARVEATLETDPPEAARAARLLLEADPYDLGALRLTLHALRAAGNHRSLTRAYADARARLNEVGEPLPERWADFLTPHPA
jgi:hypothetical protein